MDTTANALGFGLPVLFSVVTVIAAVIRAVAIDQTYRVECALQDEYVRDSLYGTLNALRIVQLGKDISALSKRIRKDTLLKLASDLDTRMAEHKAAKKVSNLTTLPGYSRPSAPKTLVGYKLV